MEWVSGNNFFRPNPLARAGDKVHGHKHNFDHTTIVLTGAVRVRAVCPDGRVIEGDFYSREYQKAHRDRFPADNPAPSHFLVVAEVEHEITALVDETEFWCVYAHREPQGDVVQHYTGWGPAYV